MILNCPMITNRLKINCFKLKYVYIKIKYAFKYAFEPQIFAIIFYDVSKLGF